MIAALNRLVSFNSLRTARRSALRSALRTALNSETKWLNEVTALNLNTSQRTNRCIERRFSSFRSVRLASSPSTDHRAYLLNAPFSRPARSTGRGPPLRSSGPVTYLNLRVFSQKVRPQLIDRQPNQSKDQQPRDQQSRGGQRSFERKPPEKTMKDQTPNYKEAIATLNSLQSNRLEIQKRIIDRTTLRAKVERTRAHLRHLGVDQADLAAMNIVHVSGTKGKGSTCAFVESILRRKGFKTGLFVSPHLISVRERIQLDGKPIEKELFAQNFFHVYEQLQRYDGGKLNAGANDTTIPFYFNFLTLMALYTFKQQGCNAAVIEVGIGGEFDCTNVVDRPAVVGVSSLGIDHVKLLGSTLKEIAWHKAGIFKPTVAAFTADNQKPDALEVLRERAAERNCSLQICPPLDRYRLDENRQLKLGINGEVQKLNASLALQICNHLLALKQQPDLTNDFKRLTVSDHLIANRTDHRTVYAEGFRLDDEYLEAIEECKWRGRCDVIPLKNKSTFYLDGAHTVESLTHCINWFKAECQEVQISDQKLFKILIFNCTGYRDYYQLLSPLLSAEKFDLICFTTNLKTVEELNNTNSDVFYAAEDPSNRDQFKEEVLKSLNFTGTVRHFDCLENCLKDIHVKNEANLINNLKTKVLGCGSIHLIGGIMSLLNERYA